MNSAPFSNSLTLTPYPFNTNTVTNLEKIYSGKDLWPLVYIILSKNHKELYVGETIDPISRISSHIKNPKRKNLSLLTLITSDKFNKSATLDIESSLIKYFFADGLFKPQNGNAGLMEHSYYLRNHYSDLFNELWELLRKKKLAKHSLKHIDNSDIFKYSPYKALNKDQNEAILSIISNLSQAKSKRILVEGGAGTGKTVLATFLMKALKTDYLELSDIETDNEKAVLLEALKNLKKKFPNPKIALVVPMTSLRKTLKRVFKNASGLSADLVIGPSEAAKNKYDILLVDESHRLRRRMNITNYRDFDINNKRLGYTKDGTELDWILKKSINTILFYDNKQSVKPSDVRKERFIKLKSSAATVSLELKSQLRVKGGLNYINYIESLLSCTLKTGIPKFKHPEYEFLIFEKIEDLINQIKRQDSKFGLSRMVAGYAWEWKTKKGHRFDIKIENTKLIWNRVNEDWINSPNAINEVGCIHTTQGYDLNYAGVIFGKEISYDPVNDTIIVDQDQYFDNKGKINIKTKEELKEYILNIYKTLMCRAMKGTYIYVCDENLRNYLSKHIIKF